MRKSNKLVKGNKLIKFMRIVTVILILTIGMWTCSGCNTKKDDGKITVGVIQYVSHASLDNCYKGVEEALKAKYGDKVVIKRQIGSDASPDSDCATYAQTFVANKVDMIIAIATPAASSAFAATADTDIPVIFCAVSDPVAAELVQSMNKPGYNCTGTSDVLDFAAQLNLIQALQPDVKNIGVIYTTSEANSISQIKLFKEEADKKGIKVNAYGIQNDADIPQIAAKAAKENDCINNFTDNKVVNNLSVVLENANENGIPVYGSEIEQVKKGCVASVSINYVALGKVTGEMALNVLEGKKAENMAVRTISDATPVINEDVSKKLGIDIPAGYENVEKVKTEE